LDLKLNLKLLNLAAASGLFGKGNGAAFLTAATAE
jgi:hypothetical protein